MRGLIPRAGWQARLYDDRDLLVRSEVIGLAFHYSAANADETSNHKLCAARVRAIQNFHMDKRGWLDIAYNFVVCKHGGIFVGRNWFWRSAANGTNNANSSYVAVCFLGDDTVGRDDLTRAGRAAMQRVVTRFPHWYGKKAILRPHSSFVATQCPGDEIRKLIKDLR